MSIKEITATATEPQQYRVTLDSKLCTTLLNIAKHGEITTQFHITGTRAEPENNGTLQKNNNAQNCTCILIAHASQDL